MRTFTDFSTWLCKYTYVLTIMTFFLCWYTLSNHLVIAGYRFLKIYKTHTHIHACTQVTTKIMIKPYTLWQYFPPSLRPLLGSQKMLLLWSILFHIPVSCKHIVYINKYVKYLMEQMIQFNIRNLLFMDFHIWSDRRCLPENRAFFSKSKLIVLSYVLLD